MLGWSRGGRRGEHEGIVGWCRCKDRVKSGCFAFAKLWLGRRQGEPWRHCSLLRHCTKLSGVFQNRTPGWNQRKSISSHSLYQSHLKFLLCNLVELREPQPTIKPIQIPATAETQNCVC